MFAFGPETLLLACMLRKRFPSHWLSIITFLLLFCAKIKRINKKSNGFVGKIQKGFIQSTPSSPLSVGHSQTCGNGHPRHTPDASHSYTSPHPRNISFLYDIIALSGISILYSYPIRLFFLKVSLSDSCSALSKMTINTGFLLRGAVFNLIVPPTMFHTIEIFSP